MVRLWWASLSPILGCTLHEPSFDKNLVKWFGQNLPPSIPDQILHSPPSHRYYLFILVCLQQESLDQFSLLIFHPPNFCFSDIKLHFSWVYLELTPISLPHSKTLMLCSPWIKSTLPSSTSVMNNFSLMVWCVSFHIFLYITTFIYELKFMLESV